MKKAIITLFLLLFIATTAIFIACYVSFNIANPENSINKSFRKPVLSISFFRKVLRLELVGDGRYEYISKRFYPLTIHLYYQDGVSLEPATMEKVQREIFRVTHKVRPISIGTPRVLANINDKVHDEDLKELIKTYGTDTSFFSTTVPLNIFLLKYYVPNPSYAGIVIDAHSIFLFKNTIKLISDELPEPTAVEVSTILHEFGHLAGADHIDNQDCIMASIVENRNVLDIPTKIRDTYCKEDIEAIQKGLKF